MNFSKFPTTGTRHRLLGLAIAQAIGGLYAPVTRAGSVNAGNRVTVGSASDLPGDILCSLRDAVAAVKTNSTVGGCSPSFTVGVDRIDFDPSITPGTITLQNGPLIVDSSVTIQGPGQDQLTLRISGNDYVIRTSGNISLGLSNFTIAEGALSCLRNDQDSTLALSSMMVRNCSGQNAGGILNRGELQIDDSTLTSNSALSGGGAIRNEPGGTVTLSNTIVREGYAPFGAGISNSGLLNVNDSRFTMNVAGGGGGAISAEQASQTNIRNTEMSLNEATFGGALYNRGAIDIEGGVIESNIATEYGGGVDNYSIYGLTINGTTLRSNQARLAGGALYNRDAGFVTLSDVTVSGNTADIGSAFSSKAGVVQVLDSTITNHSIGLSTVLVEGATQVTLANSLVEGNLSFAVIYARNGGNLTLSNVTISNNRVFSNYNVVNVRSSATIESSTITGNTSSSAGSAVGVSLGGALELSNSIIAGHDTYDCVAGANSTITLNNNNIFQTGNCVQNAVNNITTDPELGPLADNGGPTLTHALVPTSPAINAGDSNCAPTDQRGFARDDGQCDIGAFEFGGTTPDQIFGDGFES
ncbi:MAG: choice-of-anchor Q domain-containing protein [Lysobacterales bacterium]